MTENVVNFLKRQVDAAVQAHRCNSRSVKRGSVRPEAHDYRPIDALVSHVIDELEKALQDGSRRMTIKVNMTADWDRRVTINHAERRTHIIPKGQMTF